MSRTFAYCRVSTGEQSVENQIEEIARAGFDIKPSRIITDTVSGAKPMEQRTGFTKLLEKLEEGDKLICTKLDRLGRSVADVRVTLDKLKALGVEVHCLALPRIDGSSAIGELMTNIILSFAEFERSLLRDRTKSALQRLKAEGKQLGRPKAINDDQAQAIRQKLKDGMSISALAKSYGVSRATVMRLKE